jgi:L-alanine-DL-glutamate epimerase-like enolase superfamily enzyme
MKRRSFLKQVGILSSSNLILVDSWAKAVSVRSEKYAELANHKISHCELLELNYNWPRFVGRNGKRDFHGQNKKCLVLKLHTDQGALGWGLSSKNAESIFPVIVNQKVSDLIQPQIGIKSSLDKSVDFALHDLMGVILNKPVFELLANQGTKTTSIYSGMIYLDELNPENKNKGFDTVLENCEWDFNYGYRQLKVKIGRSGRWYSHDDGLKKDIEIVKLIHENFKDRSIEILVDSNDMYTLEDTIKFLEGIGDIPIFWVEEPFVENLDDGRALRNWMDENGFKNTYYVDGEDNPNHEVCLQLGQEQMMDIFLPDIYGLGFTRWIHLQKRLKEIKMLASPHAWGNRLKTNYIAHIAAAFGNIPTIEGVTCLSDEIDFGNYQIEKGKIKVSEQPGFGMKILM